VANRDELLAYADDLLDVSSFPEYAPAGAQVLGAATVQTLVCGVSSSRELFEQAAARGAELVLVHHGLFWPNEPLVVDARLGGRLRVLLEAEITLAAYHLPLDAHPELGNNAQLARRLGVEPERRFAGLGVGGRLPEPVPLRDFVATVESVTGRSALVFPDGPDPLERVAVLTGAGASELIRAAREGYDVCVTGEPEEPSLHTARELAVTLVAAGHTASETLGVQALSAHLAERFGLDWAFVDLPNPV
jgi:dinuclear metal center YbgI/SA1388 family protein